MTVNKKKIKKILHILRSSIVISIYCRYYYHKSLNSRLVAVESRNGEDLAGNILRIMQELSKPEYGNFRFILSIKNNKHEYAKALVKRYGIKNVRFVKFDSLKSLCLMSKAKYLLNDSTYPRRYVKKEGQIYLNTWHGTPLKHMGRDNKTEEFAMGNVVRNLLQADYLLFPNEYMMNIMTKAYPLENLYKGTFLLEGYPRNSVFFTDSGEKIRADLGAEDKQIIVYMPTWRGTLRNRELEKQQQELSMFFEKLDSMLTDKQLFYIKLHPLMRSEGGFTSYKHIKDFPTEYECYDILNAANILITDYSSVFYDFACTGKKIILYTYDEKEYMSDRGMYTKLSDLPFPNIKTADELIEQINSPKNYDDTEFVKTYCPYECADAAARICRHVFLDKKVCREAKAPSNGKRNILLYPGNLSKNGLTSAFLNLLSQIDKNQYNYIVSFRQSSLRRNPERLNAIPKQIKLIPLSCDLCASSYERWLNYKHSKKGITSANFKKIQSRLYKRELIRHFGNVTFSDVIQFCGYEQYVIEMFQYFDCNRVIYVHSNMVAEITERKNQNLTVLKDAYNSYDKVALVSSDLIEPTSKISGRTDNLIVAPNFQNFEGVTKKSRLKITFDNDTDCLIFNPNGIEGVLNSSGIKFITIGRFSIEKGHERLIIAFEQFQAKHPDAQLIIIGGHGGLYAKTLNQARRSPAWNNIAIIRSISNPMPILRRCDAFVMSSYYEGLPVVLFEAAILNIPSFAPDVDGISSFMHNYSGYLNENSIEGIIQGMNDFADGKITPLVIDFNKYNKKSLAAFESLLS